MEKQILKTLDILRSHKDSEPAWAEIVALCRAAKKRMPWDSLPTPDIERDARAASQWLSAELQQQPNARCIALALDTLNMEDAAYNVQFVGTGAGEPDDGQVGLLFEEDATYGGQYLIPGLVELHQVYSQENWEEAFTLCDYVLFLGYAGIILTAALRQLPAGRNFLAALGFFDGDLFALGRKTPDGFTLICR
jgi:hypothetical protein